MRAKPGYTVPTFAGWHPAIVTLENGWGVAIATISPTLAALMLEKNRNDNRNKRPSAYGRYADDMRSGRWKLTHQGIAFDRNGDLCDGQHRLTACVTSEKSFETLVFFGIGGNEEMASLDTGAIRSTTDASRYMLGNPVGYRLISTMRTFICAGSASGRTMSHMFLLSQFQKYKSFERFHEIVFAGSAKSIPPGPARAAIMRAYYHVDRDDLIRFVNLLRESIDPSEPRDKSVKLLRKYLEACNSFGGQASQAELYRKAQRSISAYIQGDALDKLYSTAEDLFPLPTDQQIAERNALEETLTKKAG